MLQGTQRPKGSSFFYSNSRLAAIGTSSKFVRSEIVEIAVVFEAASSEECGQ